MRRACHPCWDHERTIGVGTLFGSIRNTEVLAKSHSTTCPVSLVPLKVPYKDSEWLAKFQWKVAVVTAASSDVTLTLFQEVDLPHT
jgi:hypothetical protein